MNSFSASILQGRTITVLSVFLVLLLGAFLAVNQISQAQGTCGFEDQYEWYQGTCNGNEGSSAPRVLTLTANPESIQQGASSLLSWGWNYDLSGANPNSWTCSINNGVGSVPIPGGTRLVYPSVTTTYTINCTVTGEIPWGEDEQGNTIWVPISTDYTSSATVNVTPGPSPTATLTATPSSITVGGTSTLSWSSTNATSCTGTGFSTGGATSGSLSVSPTSTANYSVACTGTGGTANAYATVTVTAAPTTSQCIRYENDQYLVCTTTFNGGTPTESCTVVSAQNAHAIRDTGVGMCTTTTPPQSADLTAGSITPTTAFQGQTRTLSGTITNIGSAGAGASTGHFQLTAPVSKNSTTASPSVSAIPAGGSAAASFSYTFQTSGTYSVRLCADWGGTVIESNEGNNCGPWTDISVSEAPVGSSVSCSVNTQSAVVGGSVTYTAHPVAAATSPYSWLGSDGASGFGSNSTAVRTFSAPGTYGMQVTATNAASAAQCPLVTVGAGWCTNATADLSIEAVPDRVRAGQSSTITWTATGVNGQNANCTVTGPGISWSSAVSAAPVCSASGNDTVTINTQSTYTLTCAGQTVTETVNVIPNFQEF